jgi:hypothetical protein
MNAVSLKQILQEKIKINKKYSNMFFINSKSTKNIKKI